MVLAMSPRTAPTTDVCPGRPEARGPSVSAHSWLLPVCLRGACGLSMSVAGLWWLLLSPVPLLPLLLLPSSRSLKRTWCVRLRRLFKRLSISGESLLSSTERTVMVPGNLSDRVLLPFVRPGSRWSGSLLTISLDSLVPPTSTGSAGGLTTRRLRCVSASPGRESTTYSL